MDLWHVMEKADETAAAASRVRCSSQLWLRVGPLLLQA